MFIETLFRFTTYHFYHGSKYKLHEKGSSSAATLLVMTKTYFTLCSYQRGIYKCRSVSFC